MTRWTQWSYSSENKDGALPPPRMVQYNYKPEAVRLTAAITVVLSAGN